MESMMMFIFVLLTTALSTITGLYVSSNRIASGDLASPGQFPYVASITENGRHFCGGFIYSARWVVTAASCVEGKPLSNLNVVVGQLSTINPDVNEQTMVVYTVTIYPEYNSTNKLNDIALIRLTKDIQFDDVNVDFIVFNEVSTNNQIKNLVMGWGATFEGGYETVNLRYGTVVIIPMNISTSCGNFTSSEFNFTTTICARGTFDYPGGSSCQYDEGSPLIQEIKDPITLDVIPTAVGIFSKTTICVYGPASADGIYTRLSVFNSWFLGTAGQQPVRP